MQRHDNPESPGGWCRQPRLFRDPIYVAMKRALEQPCDIPDY